MPRLRLENELGEIYHLGPVGQPKGVTVVFGGQAGSEGKGAIAGWLARRYNWDVAACTFMPNAGHTWVSDHSDPVVVSQLPIGLVSSSVQHLVIGATAVIDSDTLRSEIEEFEEKYSIIDRLLIHPRAQVMLPEYKRWEAENLKYIASTGKGCGAAIAAKARRDQMVVLAKDHPEWSNFVFGEMDQWINDIVDRGGSVLAEQSQGFDLDINHGVSYPYCTSRQCTPAQICADLALDPRLVTNSIAVIRTQPIRVGNVEGGHSGEYGSEEIDWANISNRAGRIVEEKTTVTKRVRRVFEFDFERIKFMSSICRPTHVALTFADYVDKDIFKKTHEDYQNGMYSMVQFSQKLHNFIYSVEQALRRPTFNPKIKLVKTGPNDEHTIDLGISLF